MTVIRVAKMGFAEIESHLGPLLEAVIETDPVTGARVITADSLRALLNRCDDVDRAMEPFGQAVFRFIMQRDATLLVPDS